MTATSTRPGTKLSAAIRWRAWFGDENLELSFPETWTVEMCAPADGPDIGESGIDAAFAAPIGTPTIRQLASGRRSACIVIDDLSRPTPGHRLVPKILAELAEAGIPSDAVLILAGVANHRQLMREDFVKKVGEDVVARCQIRNHFSWDHCDYVGTTAHGTPISLNAEFMKAEVKILVGSIVPHPVAGFAGGAKLVVPGVASIETAKSFHGPTGPVTGLANLPNSARLDVEDAARLAGVDIIVNVIPNSERGIAGLVVGDVVEAHRVGVEMARKVFATDTPVGVDIAVLSAYPKDNEFLQYPLAYNVWNTARQPIVHPGGTVVVATAGSEGSGFHSLTGAGVLADMGGDLRAEVAPRDLILFCPGVNRSDLPSTAGDVVFARDWRDAEAWLHSKHGSHASVAVFPCASMQLASGS